MGRLRFLFDKGLHGQCCEYIYHITDRYKLVFWMPTLTPSPRRKWRRYSILSVPYPVRSAHPSNYLTPGVSPVGMSLSAGVDWHDCFMDQDDFLRLQKSLDERSFQIFVDESNKARRSLAVAYFLWFFFGPFGAHKFYVGAGDGGVVYLILMLLSVMGALGVSIVVSVSYGWLFFWSVWGIIFICLFCDLFLLPSTHRKCQRLREEKILNRLFQSQYKV